MIASFIIMFGCVGFGYRYIFVQKMRLKQMKELERMILYICDEIKVNHRVLSESFKIISQKCSQPFDGWLLELACDIESKNVNKNVSKNVNKNESSFIDIWDDKIKELCKLTYLYMSDMEELNNIGHAFGKDVTACLNNISVEKEHLHLKTNELEEDIKTKNKVGMALSTTVGILLIIVLW